MIQDAYLKYNPYVPFLPETEITFLCFACAFMAGIWLRGWYLCVRCHHFHPAHGLCTSDWFFLAWKKSMFWIFARFLCTKSFLQKKYPNGFSGKPCNPTFRWGTLLSPFQCYSAPGIRWSFLGGFKQGAAPFDWLLFVGEVGSPFFFQLIAVYIFSLVFFGKIRERKTCFLEQSGSEMWWHRKATWKDQSTDSRCTYIFFNSFGPVPEKIGEEAEGFVTGLLHQSLEVRC